MLNARRDLTFGCTIRPQLVRDDTFWRALLLFHQPVKQAFRCFLIALSLKNFIQNNAVLINGPPQPKSPAFDLHDDFVQMPNVAGHWLSLTQFARNGWAKFRNPSADGLVRNINPTFQKHLFNLAKAEVETTI
ncbi:hypothetical protein AN476_19020 [Phaeobacter sp. 11ANDIMAR09]|nr:hypothetical protein AN476_19020 [Phaeobacter sp. 11ANDIMAR09]